MLFTLHANFLTFSRNLIVKEPPDVSFSGTILKIVGDFIHYINKLEVPRAKCLCRIDFPTLLEYQGL